MTRATQVPGQDRGSSGAKGVFAQYMQGGTPKYAINEGFREDLFRKTMARMFVRIDQSEMPLFLSSIADTHTRSKLAGHIAGDPVRARTNPNSSGTSDPHPEIIRNRNVSTNGYLDFLIQNVQMPLQEKVQVSETLSDNYVAYTFGQAPPVWSFTGALINTVQDDQASNMFRLYTHILRATQMARRQKSLSLSFDSYVVNGVMMNINMTLASNNELVVPFSFQLLVKRVFITNYTPGWVPTNADSPFASDLNAIPYDPNREDRAETHIAVRPPAGSQEAPVPQEQADARTTQASGVDAGAAAPNFTPAPPAPAATPTPAPASAPAPGVSSATPAPISPTASVQNPARPETVNVPGTVTNSSTAPTTPPLADPINSEDA